MPRELTYEWMHRFAPYESNQLWVVRVWTKASPPGDPNRDGEFHRQREQLQAAFGGGDELVRNIWSAKVAEALHVLEFVSAIEVLDAKGNGAICYADWP